MTLYKLVQDVCNLGKSSPNVNFVTQGDIYQLNHNQDVEYPAFVVTQGTHTGSDYDEEQFTLTLFAVDRLVSDKSNEIDVQSWANGVLLDVIKKIGDFYIGTVQSGFKIQTFTEKFDSLCAGAYVTLAINVENMDCDCGSKSIGFVTSVNGQTGDVTIKGYEGAVVSSVNGQTGDVYLNIPYKVSDLRNDVPFASESYVNNKIKDVSTYVSNNYLKKGDVPVLDDYYTKEEVDDKIKDVSVDLSDYYTKEQTDDRYLKKGDVPIVPTDYVHIEDFNQYVQDQNTIDEAQNGSLEAHGRDISQLTDSLSGKQDSLRSGENIKTINGESILGEGNIVIQGGSDTEHVNLTLAEYNRLTDSEKMNGKVYFITDIKYCLYSDYVALYDKFVALENRVKALEK